MPDPETIRFQGAGSELSGVLHYPDGRVLGCVVLAHCFTCSKSFKIMRHVATGIAEGGYAVLRFDFTGLGESGGEFANTSVTTNVDDIEAAVSQLNLRELGPSYIVGHSLGGAAALLAAHRLPEITGVAVIAAPSTAAHVARHFATEDVKQALSSGRIHVEIAGRPFELSAEFFEDLQKHDSLDHVRSLGCPLLVVHPTTDELVDIKEGEKIFFAAKQPRWFVALPGANHLLTEKVHAAIAADVIVQFFNTTSL